MDLELRESVDLVREIAITLAPGPTGTIERGRELRLFKLDVGERFARGRTLEWFRDVVGQ